MATFDVFISHSSKNKELARFAFYNGVSNGLALWFDEALIHVGDDIRPVLRQGIADSRAYLLLHSKEAMADKSWVPFEMDVAKDRRTADSGFRIIVIKLYPPRRRNIAPVTRPDGNVSHIVQNIVASVLRQ